MNNVIEKEDFVIGFSDDLIEYFRVRINNIIDNWDDDYEYEIKDLATVIRVLKEKDKDYNNYNVNVMYRISECQMGGYCIKEVEIN